MTMDQLAGLESFLEVLPEDVAEVLEIEIKYEGYLARQEEEVARFKRMENTIIPEDMTYVGLPGLSR